MSIDGMSVASKFGGGGGKLITLDLVDWSSERFAIILGDVSLLSGVARFSLGGVVFCVGGAGGGFLGSG